MPILQMEKMRSELVTDWQRHNLNPGLSDFQSLGSSSYPTLPKDKDQGLHEAKSRVGPRQQRASL